jgi:hypothetical protein
MPDVTAIDLKELVDNVSDGRISSFPEFEMRVLLVGHSFGPELFSVMFERITEVGVYKMLTSCLERGIMVECVKDENINSMIKLQGTDMTVPNKWCFSRFDYIPIIKAVALHRPSFVILYYLGNTRKFMFGDRNHADFEECVYGIFKTVAKNSDSFKNGVFKKIEAAHSEIRTLTNALS